MITRPGPHLATTRQIAEKFAISCLNYTAHITQHIRSSIKPNQRIRVNKAPCTAVPQGRRRENDHLPYLAVQVFAVRTWSLPDTKNPTVAKAPMGTKGSFLALTMNLSMNEGALSSPTIVSAAAKRLHAERGARSVVCSISGFYEKRKLVDIVVGLTV